MIVPVLARPANVEPLLDSLWEATPEPYRVLFVADEGDDAEIAAIERAGADYITTTKPRNNYASKINAGYHASTEPLFFTGADDLRFHVGWLSEAIRHLSDTVKVVGTNDLGNPRVIAGNHSTHTLITREYIETESGVIDRPDTVLCESYPHEYCDDELIQTAIARGRFAHAHDSVVEHLHPIFGKAEDDATYRLGRARTRIGKRIFLRRKRLWKK